MREPIRAILIAIAAALALCAVGAARADAAGGPRPFHEQVDLRPLGRIAVFTEGRLKSFGSFANSQMQFVTGPRSIQGQGSDFTYLDMLFRPDAYADADVIYIKNREVRTRLAQALLRADPSLAQRMEAFESSGLISPELLSNPALEQEKRALQGDLVRSAKQMDAIAGAMQVMQPAALLGMLRVIPPGDGSLDKPWRSIGDVMLLGADPAGLPAAVRERPAQPIDGIPLEAQTKLAKDWRDLVTAWQRGDAATVNARLEAIAQELPALKPAIYPDQSKLAWESWYFRNGNMSWGWFVFLGAIVFLLLGLVYRWPRATTTGLVVFAGAFALQTFAVMLRWYVSGRWPNSNMFEAVTTAAWMGTALAVIAEVLLRRTRMRGLLALGASVASMVALMAAHFLPVQLNPNISNMMPVLHDVWLYIHTNVVIFSYALIFMAAVSAAAYLVLRAVGAPAVYARVGGAGAAIALAAGEDPDAQGGLGGATGAQASGAHAAAAPADRRRGLAEVLDGVTMLLMELSFVMLWAGIVMGAIWADHSWGRPWGWDPKEVFALNTFIVFALLIHVRWKVRDKGLWTAILSVVGAAVMIFNWVVINFVITGLHSYA
ncbi:MAG: cytochrome c biogenesis protein CcsA [Phycisphaerales bacterium]